jgi:hypothetical protein
MTPDHPLPSTPPPTVTRALLLLALALAPIPLAAQSTSGLARGARASESSALAREWDARLRGRRITMLGRVNGGTAGGGTWRKEYSLCRDGRAVYVEESSVAVYVPGANASSGGRKREDAVWRVVTYQDTPALEFVQKADTGYAAIGRDERGRTYVNGERAYVTEEGERCGSD